jgi:hypothetical protein
MFALILILLIGSFYIISNITKNLTSNNIFGITQSQNRN